MEQCSDAGAFRDRLMRQRDVLLASLGSDALPAAEPDPTRAGRLTRLDDLQHKAMSAEALRRRRRELARVEAALHRLEEGEYGECAVCGEPIAPARLDVDPAAEQCIRCATRAEEQVRR